MLRFHVRSIAAFGATLVLATATALAAMPATASTVETNATTTVFYRDLDLTHPAGVQTLKRRIADAVDRVCGPAPRLTIGERQAHQACLSAARSQALAQAGRAELAARQARNLTTASR